MPANGIIRIATPDGQVKEYDVDFQSAIVGRADGNRIVIPHVSISRRHAQLLFEDGQLMVEDFSSSTGTSIDGRTLLPGERLVIPPGSDLRFGDVRCTYILPGTAPAPAVPPTFAGTTQPISTPIARPSVSPQQVSPQPGYAPSTPPVTEPPIPQPQPFASNGPTDQSAAAAMAAQSEAVQRQFVGVTLSSPPAAIAPGTASAATVIIQNRGPVVDEFTVSVADAPAGWFEIARPRISLLPGARDEITIVIRPPADSTAIAGLQRLTVVVRSRQHGVDVRAVGEFTITSVERLEARLRPVRGKGTYTLEVTNNGNTVAPLLIEGMDDEEALAFQVPAGTVVQPGETKSVAVSVKPRNANKFGEESSAAFRILVRSGQSSQQPIRLDGNNTYKPPLQRWKMPVIALLLLAGIGGGAFGTVRACTADSGICPDLLTNVGLKSDKGEGNGGGDPDPTAAPTVPNANTPPRGNSAVASAIPPTATTRTTVVPTATVVVSVTGKWTMVDTVTFGPSLGKTFNFTLDFVERGTTISGSGSGLTFSGTRTGNKIHVEFTRSGGSGFFDWTLGTDGRLTGTYQDKSANGEVNGGTSVLNRAR